jgi:hypothetical protein
LKYQKGIPNSDGTITWLTDWQLVGDPNGTNCDFYAALDSNGYPWWSWSMGGTLPSDIYVSRSDMKNGTWHTPSGYPALIAETYDNDMLDALPDGKIYLMYFMAGIQPIHGSLWDGSSWSVNETVSSSYVINQFTAAWESWSRSSVVDSNGNIHLIFLSTTYKLIYIKRTASGWTSETTLAIGLPKYASPSMNYYPASNKIFCYYVNDDHSIFSLCMNTVTGVWDTAPAWIINSTNVIPSWDRFGYDGRINGFSQTLNNMIGLVWVENGTVSDTYDIKFALLSPPVEVTITSPTNITYRSETVSVSFTASGGLIHKQWYNLNNGSNQTYTISTSMTLTDGTYTFNAYVNNTLGDEGSASVTFTVAIAPYTPGPAQSSSSQNVLFKVTVGKSPAVSAEIRVYDAAYNQLQDTYITEDNGEVLAYLQPGGYNWVAKYRGATLSGSFFHVEDQTVKINFATGESIVMPTLDRPQLLKIGIAAIVLIGFVAVVASVTKGKRL